MKGRAGQVVPILVTGDAENVCAVSEQAQIAYRKDHVIAAGCPADSSLQQGRLSVGKETHKPSSLAKETQNPADPREHPLSCGATICEGSGEKYSTLW